MRRFIPKSLGFRLAFILTLLIAISPAAKSQTYTWDAGGGAVTTWSTATNWDTDSVPVFAAGSTFALNTLNITANSTSTVDFNATLGIINIGDATTPSHSWTLNSANGAVLTLDNLGVAAQINQSATSFGDTISVPLALIGNVTLNNASTTLARALTISGGISSAAASGTQTILVNGTTAGAYNLSNISDGTSGGQVGLSVQGGTGAVLCTVNLSGTNTFSGPVVVGIPATFTATSFLVVQSSTALGNSTSITVNGSNNQVSSTGSRLTLANGVTITGKTLTLAGNGNRATLFVGANSTAAWNGDVVTVGGGQFYAEGTAAVMTVGTASNTITGTGLTLRGATGIGTINSLINLTGVLGKTDSSTWILTHAGNNWTGTTVAVGTLRTAVNNALPPTTVITMGQNDTNAGTLDLFGTNQTIGGLILSSGNGGNKTITNTVAATQAVLTLNNPTTDYVFGVTNPQFAVITGNLRFVKEGAAVFSFGGTSTFTGGLVVNAGTVNVGGTMNYGAGGFTVNGGTLNINVSGTANGGMTVNGGVATATVPVAYTGGNTVAGGILRPSGGGTVGNVNNAMTVNSGTFDLNGTNQTVGNFTGTGGSVRNDAQFTASVLTIGSGNGTGGVFTGTLADNSGTGGTLGITKIGTGTITLGGTNSYSGLTTVSAGTLRFTSSPSTSSGLDVPGGGSIILAGATPIQVPNLPSLSLATGTGNASLGMQLNTPSTSDFLGTTGFAITGNASNSIVFNITALGGFGVGTYPLLGAAGGGLTAGGVNYALGATPSGFGYDVIATDTAVSLNVFNIIPSTGPIYWTGATNTKWNQQSGGNAVNFTTDAAGTTIMTGTPNATNTVNFSAATAAAADTTLETNYTINDLVFNNQTATASIGPGAVTTSTLSILPSSSAVGINVASTNPTAVTISAPVAIGTANQTWTVATLGSSLSLTGGVTGSADVTTAGSGSITLNDLASGYTGNLTINNTSVSFGGTVATTISGLISGTGAVIKDGTNILTFVNAANIYTGSTNINNGILIVAGIANGGVPSGIGASSNNAANLVFNGGALRITATTNTTDRNITLAGGSSGIALITDNSTLTLNGTISGPGALTIGLSNTLVSSLANYFINADNSGFTGNFTLNNGYVTIKSPSALGSGTKVLTLQVNTTGNARLILDGSGGNIILPPTFSYVTSLGGPGNGVFSIAGNNDIQGAISLRDGNGGTLFTAPGGTLTLSGTIQPINTGRALILGAGTGFVTGPVLTNGTNTTGITKNADPGVWTVSNPGNTYTLATVILGGTLTSGVDNAFGTNSAPITFGDNTGSALTGTLDLTNFNQTSTVLNVQSNGPTAGTLLIGAGKTLTLTNGMNAGIVNTTLSTVSRLNIVGAGSLAVTGGNVAIGVAQTTLDSVNNTTGIVDLSALTGGFSANVTTFGVGFGATAAGILTLTNTTNSITATTINVGHSNARNSIAPGGILTLGTGTNLLHADTINIGLSKIDGLIAFASQAPGSPGTVDIANSAGTGSAVLTIGSNNGTNTAAVFAATLDLRGHVSTANIGNLTIGLGNNTSSGSVAGTLRFDTGSFNVLGTVVIGSKVGGTGSADGTIALSGGSFTIQPGSTVTLATNSAATGLANGTITITGGVFTSHADITKGGGTGTIATLTLSGGTLDMAGFSIGPNPLDAVNTVTGTIQNVAQINGGAVGIVKNSPGVLTIAGTNFYSGPNTVSNGTLIVNADNSLATGATIVDGGTTGGVLRGTGTLGGPVTVNGGTVPGQIRAGNSIGVLTLAAGLTVNSGGQIFVELAGSATPAAANTGGSTTGTFPNFNSNNFLNLTGGTTTIDPGTVIVLDGTGANFAPNTSYSYKIGQGAGVQSFAITNASQFVISGIDINPVSLSFTGNAAGDLFVNFTTMAIPEPALAALLMFGWLARRVRTSSRC